MSLFGFKLTHAINTFQDEQQGDEITSDAFEWYLSSLRTQTITITPPNPET